MVLYLYGSSYPVHVRRSSCCIRHQQQADIRARLQMQRHLLGARPGLAARTSHAAGFFGFGFDKEAMPTPVRPKMPKWQERHLRATWSL